MPDDLADTDEKIRRRIEEYQREKRLQEHPFEKFRRKALEAPWATGKYWKCLYCGSYNTTELKCSHCGAPRN